MITRKRSIMLVTILVSFLLIGLASFSEQKPLPQSQANEVVFESMTEIKPGIYDNHLNTAYLRLNKMNYKRGRQDKVVDEIIAKKNEWHRLFPLKTIVSMTSITGTNLNYGLASLDGVVIHYEMHAR